MARHLCVHLKKRNKYGIGIRKFLALMSRRSPQTSARTRGTPHGRSRRYNIRARAVRGPHKVVLRSLYLPYSIRLSRARQRIRIRAHMPCDPHIEHTCAPTYSPTPQGQASGYVRLPRSSLPAACHVHKPATFTAASRRIKPPARYNITRQSRAGTRSPIRSTHSNAAHAI